MVDADRVARKLLSLNEALSELQRPEAADPQALTEDPLLRAAVERWLQVSIEACIDLAAHLIASEGWTPPQSARAGFLVLAAHGRIPLELGRRLGLAASLRNLLVHDYAAVDLTRLAASVREDAGDLRAFAAQAAAWMKE